jgi:hypothetical protein
MRKISWPAVLILLLFSSCEKAVNFNLDKSDSKLVVDASIENNRPPIVILSKSLDYFNKITPELLSQSFVHDAAVFISDGNGPQQLREYAIDNGSDSLYYYSTQVGNVFLGAFETSYDLRVEVNNEIYTAHTSIPGLAKKIDSVWWKDAPANPDTNKAVVMARVSDPPGYGNYIRYFTSVNSGPFLPGLNSVFDDQVVDGTIYTVTVDNGVNRNGDIDFNEYSFFEKGDTVVLKFCNIDKATFDFWRTMEYNYQSIGNPFSSPTKVLGNISNNALGYFGGYAVQYMSVILQK